MRTTLWISRHQTNEIHKKKCLKRTKEINVKQNTETGY